MLELNVVGLLGRETYLDGFAMTKIFTLYTTSVMEKILRNLLAKEKVDNEVEFKELAIMTEGYTGSDLKNLCTNATYRPARELIQQERLKSLVSGTCIIYFEFNWYDLKNYALIFIRYLS
ncbi:hypothetical protein JHK82_039526 [Glycine max]|uniref:AAA ATPase AAA+ lid domain-containing protein n=2 Tax=Glycine subgen. Soja TaxID=1462606 RepID=K7M691_SOYBN|nr:hypothetical protein JHK87_039509 [Glycine soja]KAG4962845.1 hypothetical protein JHK86_039713 [Glycine max]KAG4965317.1 hypothetical protein JHK85_040292 [Glycine max]KAG5110303.1 hypothetical protein JHK82_039526 [Glycine max]KAG5121592.1 hypothetical protein JHK84_039932 [Glycine max]